MDKRKLESFLALARTLHFAKAASQVNITQPALSQHIQSLEQSWGVRLFERDKRHVSLTAAGKMVIAEVERTVEQLNRLSDTVRHVAGGGSTVLRLGYVGTSVLESLIVSAIRTFRTSFPDVLLEAGEFSVGEQVCLLQNGDLDIGIIRGPMPINQLITHRIIQQQPLKLVSADNHALHFMPEIRMQHLANETLIILDDPEGVGLGGTVLKLYADSGIIPSHIKRVRDLSTAVDLVALGAGITFIPATQLNSVRSDVVTLDISDAQPETSLFLCWKKGHLSRDLRHFSGLIP